jgi:hypothetical protein
MRLLITASLILFSLAAVSQTKKIAFKSHSGSDENFATAMENDLFDMDNSNFGLPSKETYTIRLDSVIFISDTASAVVVTHFATSLSSSGAKPVVQYVSKDTLYSNPLFSQKHSLDSIRRVLKASQQYNYNPEKAVFVGYDNKKRKKTSHSELIPVIPTSDPGTSAPVSANPGATDSGLPFDRPALIMLSMVFVFSLLAGLIAWKYKFPHPKARLFPGN